MYCLKLGASSHDRLKCHKINVQEFKTKFQFLLLKKKHFLPLFRGRAEIRWGAGGLRTSFVQDLNTCTARTTYCRQMGHSLMRLPHLVHVTMCPHSKRTQSMGESIQILQRFSSPGIPDPASMPSMALDNMCCRSFWSW